MYSYAVICLVDYRYLVLVVEHIGYSNLVLVKVE